MMASWELTIFYADWNACGPTFLVQNDRFQDGILNAISTVWMQNWGVDASSEREVEMEMFRQ